MGWARGSGLMNEVIDTLKRHVPDPDQRRKVYNELIGAFEDLDCDTLYECYDDGKDTAFTQAWEKLGKHTQEDD